MPRRMSRAADLLGDAIDSIEEAAVETSASVRKSLGKAVEEVVAKRK
jgi:hypothetical protein